MELLFPLLATSVVLLVVLPATCLLASGLLSLLAQVDGLRVARWHALRYLLLVLPALLPLGWAFSAALHLAEPGRSVLACLLRHDFEQLCWEPVVLLALLTGAVSARVIPLLRRARGVPAHVEGRQHARVEALIQLHPALRELERRTAIASTAVGGVVTLGLVHPRVVLDAGFVDSCDDETLVGALAHELEHVRGLDPLRYLLLALCLRVSPAGERLLGRHAAAWIFGREVQCDRAAVLRGAVPFGVARALLRASRPESAVMAHIAAAPSKLRLRVELLLSYAERRPTDDVARGRYGLFFGAILLVLALAVPHAAGTSLLDRFHTQVETVAASAFH